MIVIYEVSTSNVKWENLIIVNINDSDINKIELEWQDTNTILISFYFKNELEKDIVKDITSKYINHISNVMFYEFNILFKDTYLTRIQYKEFAEVSTRLDLRQVIYRDLSEIQKDKFISTLSNYDDMEKIERNRFFYLYKSAMQVEDCTARFMFLYSILLQLFEDSKRPQEDIDNFIRTYSENKVLERKSTKHSFNETIYTWLRNQMGHTQQNSNINLVRNEIGLHITGLEEIVKKAIFT